jgi:hypothetical protein
VGAWAGTLAHEGQSTPFALELEPGEEGKVRVKMSIPVIHVAHSPIGNLKIETKGDEVRLGPFVFIYDAKAGTLIGTLPETLAPVYRIPLTLRRVEHLDLPVRAESTAPIVRPEWTFDAGAPLWAGARFAEGVVYAGGEDGRLHALDARTGKERWSYRAGGALRSRVTTSGADVFFQPTTASSPSSSRRREKNAGRCASARSRSSGCRSTTRSRASTASAPT